MSYIEIKSEDHSRPGRAGRQDDKFIRHPRRRNYCVTFTACGVSTVCGCFNVELMGKNLQWRISRETDVART